MLRTSHAIITASVAIGLLVGCARIDQSASGNQPPLTGHYAIKGGGSALAATRTLTDAFTRAHPGITFELEDVGSDAGVALTARGAVDLGMISRSLKPAEQGQVESLQIGASGTGVVVNTDNPIKELTRDQVRGIFAGAISNWAEVGGTPGPISVFIREPDSSTRSTFEGYAFTARPSYSPDAVEVHELDPMFNAVHGIRAAVGMAVVDSRTLADTSVRFVAIDGVAPSVESLRSGAYPIRRPLFLTYRASGLPPAVEAFLDFVRGPDGQRLTASQ